LTEKTYMEGQVYFRVVYPDTAQSIPLVQSFVYVGQNLSDDDVEETLYFQFADGYAKNGSILDGPGGDRRVTCTRGSESRDMLSVEELADALVDARKRRST